MKLIKKYGFYVLSFIVPCIIILIFLIANDMFKGHSILTSDLLEQETSFLKYFHNLLHGVASFPYTFSNGLGGSMYSTLFYYLGSPLNLLIYFFDDVNLFCTIMLILKLSLCSLTMFIYLKHKFNCKQWWLLIFSLTYALMSYNLNNYVQIMWLDGVVLAPLILLGIDKYIKNGKTSLYIITLFWTIVSNFYIGYTLTIFSIIYYLYQLCIISNDNHWIRNNKKKIIRFIVITFLTGLLTSFILIPIFLASRSFMRVSSLNKMFNSNILDIILGSYMGLDTGLTILNPYHILFYSGILMLPLIISYFTNKEVSTKEKKITLLVYVILFLPVIIQPLNLIWHLFTYPNFFNYRYSFIITIFTLIVSVKSFLLLNNSIKTIMSTFIIYFLISKIIIFLSAYPKYNIYLSREKVIVTVLLLGIYCILILLKKKRLILCLLCIEIIINFNWTLYNKPFSFTSNYKITNIVNDISNKYCNNLNRCEFLNNYNVNGGLFSNYNGVSSFSSTTNKKQLTFLSRSRGVNTKTNNYTYNTYDLLSDMLLGVEYIWDFRTNKDYELVEDLNYNNIAMHIYRNPYALSLGYMVSPKIKTVSTNEDGYKYLNEVLMAMEDSKDSYLIKLPVRKINDNLYEVIKNEQYPYIYITSDVPAVTIVNIAFEYKNSSDIYDIIYDQDNQNLKVEFGIIPEYVDAYTVDVNKVKNFKDSRVELKVDINNGNYLHGNINVLKDGVLFFSIVNEEGWEVYVDGTKVKHYELLDTFIGVDLTKGIHEIELRYKVPGLKLGISLSIISLIALIIYEDKIGCKFVISNSVKL